MLVNIQIPYDLAHTLTDTDVVDAAHAALKAKAEGLAGSARTQALELTDALSVGDLSDAAIAADALAVLAKRALDTVRALQSFAPSGREVTV